MTGGGRTVKPPHVVPHVAYVCMARPRRCERIETRHCTSCGWSSALGDDLAEPADDGTPSLFDQPEHTPFECRRRQLDPAAARAQDLARLRELGFPEE